MVVAYLVYISGSLSYSIYKCIVEQILCSGYSGLRSKLLMPRSSAEMRAIDGLHTGTRYAWKGLDPDTVE